MAKDEIVRLKDKQRGSVWLTVRGGVVVGAAGSEPKRFMNLPIEVARYIARYGAAPTERSKGGDRVVADLERWGVDKGLVAEVRDAFVTDPRRAMALARDLGWTRSAKRGRNP